jgi:hypothetical protein
VPPPGWSPPPEWPPAPPGWQWWGNPSSSGDARLRFHLLGAGLLLAALVAWWFLAAGLSFFTAACAPDPGDPVALRLGVGLGGAGVTLLPAWWAWRARRLGYLWAVWAGVAAIAAAGAIDAVVSVQVAGCPFTF